MSRYIDAELLKDGIESIDSKYGNDNESLISQPSVLDLIEEQPTVDAVDVIRCKDCIWHETLSWVDYCIEFDTETKLDDFCSRGEK